MSRNRAIEDRRVKRTKRNLKSSMITLLSEQSYEQITVTDIVEKADYNRTTFYRHYQDKQALSDEIVHDILNKLVHAFRTPYIDSKYLHVDHLSPANVTIFNYILKHKSFYSLWKYNDGIPGFQEQFIHTLIKLHKEDIKYNLKEIENDYFIIFRAYGVWGLILQWIKNDFSVTPDEMAEQLIKIISYRPANVYETKRDLTSKT